MRGTRVSAWANLSSAPGGWGSEVALTKELRTAFSRGMLRCQVMSTPAPEGRIRTHERKLTNKPFVIMVLEIGCRIASKFNSFCTRPACVEILRISSVV